LAIAQLLLDPRLDVLLRLEDADLSLHVEQNTTQSILDGEGLEQSLPFDVSYLQIAGHEIGQATRILHGCQDLSNDLFRETRFPSQVGRAVPQLAKKPDERRIIDLGREHLFRVAHDRLEVFPFLADPQSYPAATSLDQELYYPAALLEMTDPGDRADCKQ
jgi:hypothetical protein